jgi:hypothetical protein
MFSVSVSTSELPFRDGAFTEAHIDSSGNLILTATDGHLEIMDLSETRNRDLMMAVVGDIIPKFKDFSIQKVEKPKKRSKVKKKTPPPPEPLPPVTVPEEVPVSLPEPDVPPVPEEAPAELTIDAKPEPQEVPALSAEETSKIEEITSETMEYLGMLGDEVFDQSPVSVYFDDWLVNLRQVILGFESNDAIVVDEDFTNECEQIFRDIEEELANRLLKEAELEASSKKLAQNKYALGEIDAEYTAQTKYVQVRGKSALDFLIKNVQRLEEELEKIKQIKTLNPIKRIIKEQKRYDVTKKLKAAKKRLELATQNSAGAQENLEVETGSMDDLIKNVTELEEELAKLHQTKTLNPIKKIAQEQKVSEVTEKLNTAKQKLALAAQKAETEQQRIHDEYEKKKQTTIMNVQTLEKEIETKRTDGSIEARKAATKALANAIKSLAQRNTEPKSSK